MTFEEYDKEKTFSVVVLEDDLPELEMNVTIQLRVINGKFPAKLTNHDKLFAREMRF